MRSSLCSEGRDDHEPDASEGTGDDLETDVAETEGEEWGVWIAELPLPAYTSGLGGSTLGPGASEYWEDMVCSSGLISSA